MTPCERPDTVERPRDRGGPKPPPGLAIGLWFSRQAVLDLRDDLGGDRAHDFRFVVLDLDHAVLPAEHLWNLAEKLTRPEIVGTS